MSEPLDPKEAATLFYAGHVLGYVDDPDNRPPFACGQWQGQRAYVTQIPFDEAGAEQYFTDNPVAMISSLVGDLPVLIDAPLVVQDGQTLTCTQGNWQEPASTKTYQWRSDGTGIEGETAASYEIIEEDVGHPFDCIVTATNPFGSTSSTSNSVVATAPARRR